MPEPATAENQPVAKALRLTMAAFSLSRTEFAERAGLSATEISRFAKGRRVPRADKLISLVNALPTEARSYCVEQLFPGLSSTTVESRMSEPRPLARFIKRWQQEDQIGQLEFELAVQQRTTLTIERLHEIQAGSLATQVELTFLGAIIMKPDGQFYTLLELIDIQNGDYNPYNGDPESHAQPEPSPN